MTLPNRDDWSKQFEKIKSISYNLCIPYRLYDINLAIHTV